MPFIRRKSARLALKKQRLKAKNGLYSTFKSKAESPPKQNYSSRLKPNKRLQSRGHVLQPNPTLYVPDSPRKPLELVSRSVGSTIKTTQGKGRVGGFNG